MANGAFNNLTILRRAVAALESRVRAWLLCLLAARLVSYIEYLPPDRDGPRTVPQPSLTPTRRDTYARTPVLSLGLPKPAAAPQLRPARKAHAKKSDPLRDMKAIVRRLDRLARVILNPEPSLRRHLLRAARRMSQQLHLNTESEVDEQIAEFLST